MTNLERAIKDGYAHIIGEKGKQKITYVSSDNHVENYSDPEEKVRAEFWAELIYKYEYPVNRIKIEVTVPDRLPTDRADIVVFRDDECKRPYAVVECKKDGVTDAEFNQAIEQGVGNATWVKLRADYVVIIAGGTRRVLDVTDKFGALEREQNILADLPHAYGKPQEFRFYKGSENDIKPVDREDLIAAIKKCHQTLWGGGRLSPPTAFGELCKLIFVDNNPDVKVKTAMNWASQVWPFAHEMKKGEIVVLPSKIKPVIHFGKITGNYEFLPNNDNPYYHAHQVDWFACDIPRTAFDQDILYSFGAFMTICRIKQEDRIKAVINAHKQGKKAPQITPQEPQDDEEARDIENEALGVITNLIIQKTKGHGLAKIVDAILRAKGFTTYVSPAGPDKGVDILTSAGTLGFGSPKICVQVKSTDAPVDRIVLDQLGGVMKNFGAEYGLLVSWSGFKSSVINEMAKQFFEIRLWTHKEIIEEFLRYYDRMDDEIKELIPLKKIWVVSNDDQ